MLIKIEDIPTEAGVWTVHVEYGPGSAHFEERWAGSLDGIMARLFARLYGIVAEVPKAAPLDPEEAAPVEPVVEPVAPKRASKRATA